MKKIYIILAIISILCTPTYSLHIAKFAKQSYTTPNYGLNSIKLKLCYIKKLEIIGRKTAKKIAYIKAEHSSDIASSSPEYKLSLTINKKKSHSSVATFKDVIPKAKKFILPYHYSKFSIEYIAANSSLYSNVFYSYILEGFEEQWNHVNSNKTATYTNIPPGKYIFKVRAFLEDNPSLFEEENVIVKIAPPYWKYPWDYITYTIIIISITLIIIKVINTLIALKNKIKIEQQLSELKLKFFINFSHELRIPLTLIEAPIDSLLTKNKVPADVHENLSLALKNVKRMSQMVNEILTFRKAMKGEINLNVTITDIVLLIRNDIIPAFKPYANEKDITLTLHTVFDAFEIWLDKNKIQHVMFNLLSNACKFTPNGGAIQIEIFTKNKNILISVSDTGIGIPPEKLELIFERFVQCETTTDTCSTGIGLSLSKEYVKLHNGELWASNNATCGSKFFMSLPINNIHFDSTEHLPQKTNTENIIEIFNHNPSVPIRRRTDYIPNTQHPSILLVENNTELRIFIFNQLIDNYQVFEAEDGEKGFMEAKKVKPDIIISDLMMPSVGGLQMTEKLKNDSETSHIPVILLTAQTSVESRLLGVKCGADCYIIKPFSMDLLNAYIKNMLTKRQELMANSYNTKHQASMKPSKTTISEQDKAFIKRMLQYMENYYSNSGLKIDDLSSLTNLSRTSFYMKFKSLFGKSPIQFINDFRLTKAEQLIKSSQYSISEVSYKVGFDNPGYFNRRFKEKYGYSPGKYAKMKDNF